MIVWIKPSGDRPNRQRARIIGTEGRTLRIELQGYESVELVDATLVCGVELSDSLSIFFDVTRYELKPAAVETASPVDLAGYINSDLTSKAAESEARHWEPSGFERQDIVDEWNAEVMKRPTIRKLSVNVLRHLLEVYPTGHYDDYNTEAVEALEDLGLIECVHGDKWQTTPRGDAYVKSITTGELRQSP